MCVPGWKRASGPGVVGGLRLWRWSPPVPSHWGGVRGRGTGIAGVSHFLFPFSPASPGGQCQLRLAPCICSFSVRGLSVVLSCCSTVCACYRTGSRSSHPRSAVSLSLSLVLQRILLRIINNPSFEFEQFLRILTIAILMYQNISVLYIYRSQQTNVFYYYLATRRILTLCCCCLMMSIVV